jgi:translation initiation factor 2 subunit 1
MVKKIGKPKEDELVICKVKEIGENSAWCEILEYPDYRGIINFSELPSSDIKEVLKLEKQYVAKIIRIDNDKKILELSLKRVKEFEKKEKWDEFERERRAEKILELIGKKHEKTLEEIYEEFGNKILEKYGSLSSFISLLIEKNSLLEEIPIKYRKDLKEILENLKKRKKVKITYILTAQSFTKKLEEIKEVLLELEKFFEVKYLGGGKYMIAKLSEKPKKDEKEIIERIEKLKDFFDVFKYEKIEKV